MNSGLPCLRIRRWILGIAYEAMTGDKWGEQVQRSTPPTRPSAFDKVNLKYCCTDSFTSENAPLIRRTDSLWSQVQIISLKCACIIMCVCVWRRIDCVIMEYNAFSNNGKVAWTRCIACPQPFLVVRLSVLQMSAFSCFCFASVWQNKIYPLVLSYFLVEEF